MVLPTEQSGGCSGSDAVETAGGYCLMGWATGYCGFCAGLVVAVVGCGWCLMLLQWATVGQVDSAMGRWLHGGCCSCGLVAVADLDDEMGRKLLFDGGCAHGCNEN